MATFKVLTSGPCFTTSQKNLDAAIEWAQNFMPLKRGWTFKVNKYGNSACIHRYNSKGRKLDGYSVTVVRVSARNAGWTDTRKSRVRVSLNADVIADNVRRRRVGR